MKKFEVGKKYNCRSFCDHDCIWTLEVIARTAKTITLSGDCEPVRRTVAVMDGIEFVFPLGHYSMAPILRAIPIYTALISC